MTVEQIDHKQRIALEALLKAYIAERDCHYESLTLVNGEYCTKYAEYIIEGMDTVIRNARAALRFK